MCDGKYFRSHYSDYDKDSPECEVVSRQIPSDVRDIFKLGTRENMRRAREEQQQKYADVMDGN